MAKGWWYCMAGVGTIVGVTAWLGGGVLCGLIGMGVLHG